MPGDGSSRAVQPEKTRLVGERGDEIPQLRASELKKFWRRGRAGPALQENQSGENFSRRRTAQVQIHLHGDGISWSGGREVGWKKETKHVAR